MDLPRPIEIIGGGLAGLSLALALRRAGAPVTVFEAGDYPRHRVCGEFITGLSDRTIGRLGLGPILTGCLHHHEIVWFMGEKPLRIQRLPSPALGLSRYALDARLADALVAAGGTLHTRTRIAEPEAKPGCIFATGRRLSSSPWLGLKVHVRGLALHRELEVHLGDEGYVGLAAIEGGGVNACGFFRRRTLSAKGAELVLAYLQACRLGPLAARLAAAEIDDSSFCAVAAVSLDGRVPPLPGIRLGDACAMIPPFTGNGMAMAFQSAETALGPLLAYSRGQADWPETGRTVNAALRRRFRRRLAAAAAIHPFIFRPRRQRWLAALNRSRLLPLRPLYSLLH